MKKLLIILGLVLFISSCGKNSKDDRDLPQLVAKSYSIGIAPSHIVDTPNSLFESDSNWRQLSQNIDYYKYYGGQLMQGKEWNWINHIDSKSIVEFSKHHQINIGCEFGDFHLEIENINDTYKLALQQLDPIFESGGKVSSIHLDGPFRRMIKGINNKPNAMNLKAICNTLSEFWINIHNKYPEIKIGLIVNLPNWDYTKEFVGYNGYYTDQSGYTYLQILDTLNQRLNNLNKHIDFIEIDCPYNYYKERYTRNKDSKLDNPSKFINIQKWCKKNHIDFNLIINAEHRQRGAMEFYNLTCKYVQKIRNAGIFPDTFTIQSWFTEPSNNLPETEKYTFTNSAKDAIFLINELYPKSNK